MSEEQLDQIAELVAEKLQTSILKLPPEVSEVLKKYQGWLYRGPICSGDWPLHIETTVLARGGLRVGIYDASGQRWFERVLEP